MTIDGKRVSRDDEDRPRAGGAACPSRRCSATSSIESAEAWADSVLQDGVRQLARYAIGQDEESMATLPARAAARASRRRRREARRCRSCGPVVSRQMRPKPGTAEACLAALPGQLDRVDALLAEGVIGGERPNAADFQIAPSVRLMLNFDQLREHVDARPAGRHARGARPRLSRPLPGSVPGGMAPVLDVTLPGEIAAWHYAPEGATACVVMAHGLLRGARAGAARLRRALRRRRPRRACCSTTAASAPAAASRGR